MLIEVAKSGLERARLQGTTYLSLLPLGPGSRRVWCHVHVSERETTLRQRHEFWRRRDRRTTRHATHLPLSLLSSLRYLLLPLIILLVVLLPCCFPLCARVSSRNLPCPPPPNHSSSQHLPTPTRAPFRLTLAELLVSSQGSFAGNSCLRYLRSFLDYRSTCPFLPPRNLQRRTLDSSSSCNRSFGGRGGLENQGLTVMAEARF